MNAKRHTVRQAATTDAPAPTTRRSRSRPPLRAALVALRAAARTAVFLLKVYPMLPSRALDTVTPRPVIESVTYPAQRGPVRGDLYRPDTPGPHPGLVVCLGVVPFGVDHPQVPRLGTALARAGFAALLYWSPAMRDQRLYPDDGEDIALAYDWLLAHPAIDPSRSGLLGTCVGGAFALLAAAHPRIRDRVAFVAAYAPYAEMATLARDVASASREGYAGRERWAVDPLTRTVFVRSLTAELDAAEAERLRMAGAERNGPLDHAGLSAAGRAIAPLLTALDVAAAEAAVQALPPVLQARLSAMSPLRVLPDLHAPLVVLLHDRDDVVIPVGETRRLWAGLAGRPGVHYTEFTVFQHLDPTKGRPPLLRLAWELGRFYRAVYPIFRQAVVT